MAAFQGTYYAQYFTVKSDGVAVNITGWTFRAMIRRQLDDEEELVELTTANGGLTITDAANGRVRFALTAAQTELLPVGRVVFDLMRTDPANGPLILCSGKFRVKQPVTRDE